MNKIDQAKKILLATKKDADLDELVAAISLAHILKQHKKEVTLLLPSDKYSHEIFNDFPLKDIKNIEKSEPDKFILSIPKKNAIVKDVKWKDNNGAIEIHISTEKGEIDTTSSSIKPHSALYDLIILVNTREPKEIGDFYAKNKTIFPQNKLYYLPENHKNNAPICANILDFVKTNNWDIDSITATDLLAGILWKTNGLQFVTGNNLNSQIQYLLSNKADLQMATQKAYKRMDVMDTRIIETILKNLTIKHDKFAYSIIKNARSKGISPEKVKTLDWFIFSKLKSIETFIVMFELQDSVIGYIINTDQNKDAREITNKYQTTGNRYLAKFTTKELPNNIEKSVLNAPRNNETEEPKQTTASDPLAPATSIPKPIKFDDEENIPTPTPPPPLSPK